MPGAPPPLQAGARVTTGSSCSPSEQTSRRPLPLHGKEVALRGSCDPPRSRSFTLRQAREWARGSGRLLARLRWPLPCDPRGPVRSARPRPRDSVRVTEAARPIRSGAEPHPLWSQGCTSLFLAMGWGLRRAVGGGHSPPRGPLRGSARCGHHKGFGASFIQKSVLWNMERKGLSCPFSSLKA